MLSLLLQEGIRRAQQLGCPQSGLGAWFGLHGSSRWARPSCRYRPWGSELWGQGCPQGKPRQAALLLLAYLSTSQARWQLADLSCSWSWACRTVPAAWRSNDQQAGRWQNEPKSSAGRWEICLPVGRWAHCRAVNLLKREKRKLRRFPPPTLVLAVLAAPPPNFFLPLEKPWWLLGSRGLCSTAGSCKAVLPGELLADIYSGRLGVALWHLFSSLSFLWNTHCLFFWVTESPPCAFALFTSLVYFQQLLENVMHSGTILSPWVCFASAFDCPVLLLSLSDHFYGEKGSVQGLSRPLLQHAWVEWRLSPPDCCTAWPYYGNATLTLLSGRGLCPSRRRRSLVLLGPVAWSCTGRGFAGQVPVMFPVSASWRCEGVEDSGWALLCPMWASDRTE